MIFGDRIAETIQYIHVSKRIRYICLIMYLIMYIFRYMYLNHFYVIFCSTCLKV